MSDIKNTATDYDTCIGNRDESYAPGSLASFLGVEETPVTEEEAWKEMWVGMPTYESAKKPLKTLGINFATDKDYDEFVAFNSIRLPNKGTKSIWYPQEDKENKFLMRFVDEE